MQRIVIAMLIVLSILLTSGRSTSVEEKEMTVVEMQQEIITMWTLWLDNQDQWTQGKLKTETEKWPNLALDIAKSIKKYQRTPIQIYDWKDKTTTLPIGKDLHLIIGSMATFETNVRNGLEGKLGEIGIIQCHPRYCLVRNPELSKLPIKERKKKAKNNPNLNIDASVQHLAVSYGICNKKINNSNDWAFSVAHYGAGTKAIEKNKCMSRNFAKARISRMKKYRKKIRNITNFI